MQIFNSILYLFTAFIIIYVLNRYFSGAKFNGKRPNLWGFIAVITGGNTGIGKQTVIALAQQGCRVIFGARDTDKSQRFVKQINIKLGRTLVQHHFLDLADLQSIKNFVLKINDEKIDFLINNAGVLAIPKRKITKSGFQMQYGINYLGHFYLTHLLWPKLNKSNFFRVINLSSIAHKKHIGFFGIIKLDFSDMNFDKNKYSPSLAYSRSKLYISLFANALAQRIPKNQGLTVSLHPGIVRTEITRYMVSSQLQKFGFKIGQPIYALFTKSPHEGAQTTLSVLFQNPEQLKNGGYYADCHISKESPQVNKQNWDKLWQISQRELNIKFGQYK